jgi:hypothetical protein
MQEVNVFSGKIRSPLLRSKHADFPAKERGIGERGSLSRRSAFFEYEDRAHGEEIRGKFRQQGEA